MFLARNMRDIIVITILLSIICKAINRRIENHKLYSETHEFYANCRLSLKVSAEPNRTF